MHIDEDNINLDYLLKSEDFFCDCGKIHSKGITKAVVEKGAVTALPDLLRELNAEKAYVVSGEDTFLAAGQKVIDVLEKNGFTYTLHIIGPSPVIPNERAVGSALMHLPKSCDCIIGIGSGVINDTCKIIAAATGKKYIIVGTAPSMDGYASPSSSMERDGFKISLDSTFAYAVIGDLDILCKAPQRMLCAGMGDMIAKYISLCEWKISNIINGEYFCPLVYKIMKTALDKCVSNAESFIKREPKGVKSVMEGLIIAGIAMQYAGVSRPASGTEHYYSHIWDMRSLAFGTKADLHGIQCGVATLSTLKIYEKIKTIVPDREKALEAVKNFDIDRWNSYLYEFIGPAASLMAQQEKREKKYDPEKHRSRLETIIEKWDEILAVINELPSYDEIYSLMKGIDAPTDASEFGVTPEQERITFSMTKDVRDKYISSRLFWDLGIEY